MLFDLRSGKRRRVIQVSYAILAFLFLIGFVGFGVGSDVSGGIFDAFDGGGGSASSSQYEDEIEQLEERVAADPNDERALLALARFHALDGQRMLQEPDPTTGLQEPTEDGRGELEAAVDAWSRYLKTDPKQPSADVAAVISQAYYLLQDFEGAARAQEIVAEDSPSVTTWGRAALLHYSALEIDAGDEAAKRALAEADPSERAARRKELERYAKLAAQQKEALAKARAKGETGEPQLESPFGGLGAPGPGAE